MSEPLPQQPLDIVILSGQSGSGKSTAVRALEDAGYYCVDNLPTALAERLIDVVIAEKTATRLALVMDMRERNFLQHGPDLVQALRKKQHKVRLFFLEAQEDVVLRRYSQTRRLHPLDDGQGLRQAIVNERSLLQPLRQLADETIDTSSLTPHLLRAQILSRVGSEQSFERMRVTVVSFGFKYGVPTEADMMLDVRFLPNPYFDPALSAFSGMDAPVADFVLGKPETQEFLQHTRAFLRFLLPQYTKEQKRYFTLAIGCTGGRHRSVAIATRCVQLLAEDGVSAELRHRDSHLADIKNAQAKA